MIHKNLSVSLHIHICLCQTIWELSFHSILLAVSQICIHLLLICKELSLINKIWVVSFKLMCIKSWSCYTQICISHFSLKKNPVLLFLCSSLSCFGVSFGWTVSRGSPTFPFLVGKNTYTPKRLLLFNIFTYTSAYQ